MSTYLQFIHRKDETAPKPTHKPTVWRFEEETDKNIACYPYN